jgi:hypothetical protein
MNESKGWYRVGFGPEGEKKVVWLFNEGAEDEIAKMARGLLAIKTNIRFLTVIVAVLAAGFIALGIGFFALSY